MKQLKPWQLAFTFIGCFLGAGFVSGQELWQFFGSFGSSGLLGALLASALLCFAGSVIRNIIRARSFGTDVQRMRIFVIMRQFCHVVCTNSPIFYRRGFLSLLLRDQTRFLR